MAIKVKVGGAYVDPVAIYAKKNGVYSAITGLSAKVGGAYVLASVASFVGRAIGGRSAFPSAQRTVANSNTYTQVQQIVGYNPTEAGTDISFAFGNFSADTSDLKGLGPVTIRLGLYDGATQYPLYWKDGQRGKRFLPGDIAQTQPLAFTFVKDQRIYLFKYLVWDTAPASFPAATVPAYTGNEVNEWGNALTDRTATGGQFYSRSVGLFDILPALSVNSTKTTAPVVGILGDSISSDGANDYANGTNYVGWAARGLAQANIPFVSIGQAGLSMAAVMGNPTQKAARLSALTPAKVTHVLCPLSANDWVAGQTGAQLYANMVALKADLDAMGIKLIICTGQPKTDAGNTSDSTSGARAAYNALVIAGNGVGYGYYNLAAATQNSGTPALWRTDVRSATAVTIANGGTGYGLNDSLELTNGVVVNADTVASGVITGVYQYFSVSQCAGGFLTDPGAPVGVRFAYSTNYGVSVGTGATFNITGGAPSPTDDGTHPNGGMQTFIKFNFAAAAPALFV